MKLMMGGGLNSETWPQNAAEKPFVVRCGWREGFRVLTITLLSLLLPLSYLLLSRISTVHYILAAGAVSPSGHDSLLHFLFLHCDSTIIHSLLSLVTVAAFAHALTGRVAFFSAARGKCSSSEPALRRPTNSRLYASWIFLCTLQVCVGLGIEGSIAAGVEYGSGFITMNHDQRRRDFRSSTILRVLFFLGLHETMLFWSRSVVKPVVDDTVLGFAKEEGRVERVAMAASFGALWWWRLRDEVDSLVVVAELKRRLLVGGGVGVADFVAWWLYYVTVSIGTIRIFNALIWLGKQLLSRTNFVQGNFISYSGPEIDDKV